MVGQAVIKTLQKYRRSASERVSRSMPEFGKRILRRSSSFRPGQFLFGKSRSENESEDPSMFPPDTNWGTRQYARGYTFPSRRTTADIRLGNVARGEFKARSEDESEDFTPEMRHIRSRGIGFPDVVGPGMKETDGHSYDEENDYAVPYSRFDGNVVIEPEQKRTNRRGIGIPPGGRISAPGYSGYDGNVVIDPEQKRTNRRGIGIPPGGRISAPGSSYENPMPSFSPETKRRNRRGI